MLDFKKFKKVSENPERAILKHPDGHIIHIAKAAISKPLQKQLASLPLHQSDPEEPVQAQELPPGARLISPNEYAGEAVADGGMRNLASAPTEAPVPAISSDAVESPVAVDSGTPAAALPPRDAMQTEELAPEPTDPNADIKAMPGGEEALKSADLAAKAASNLGKQEQALQNKYAQSQKAVRDHLESSFLESTDTINKVTHDIMTSKIDPKHYLDNMSTGSKIATAFGLILGGMASARTGQNPALAFLQSQIDRDLKAQQANVDNKHNLLTALERQYQNKTQAAHMFAAIDANVLASKLAAAHSAAQTPLAQAAQQAAVAQLKGQALAFQRQAVMAGLMGKLEGAGADEADAQVDAVKQALRIQGTPEAIKQVEEIEKRHIPGVGVAKVPLDSKDRDALENMTALKTLYNQAQGLLTEGGKLGPVLPSKRADAASVMNRIQLTLGKLEDLGRFTPEENKIYQSLVPDLKGTHFTDSDKAKLDRLVTSINDKMNVFYQQKGIGKKAETSNVNMPVKGKDGRMYVRQGQYMVPVK